METTNPKDFADWLRDLMARRGYPMDTPRAGGIVRLAEDSGVSAPSISRIFNAPQFTPSIETLRALAPVLGVSLREMLIRSGRATAEELPTVQFNAEQFRRWLVAQQERTGMTLHEIADAAGVAPGTMHMVLRGNRVRGARETTDMLPGNRLNMAVRLAGLFEADVAEVLALSGFTSSAERILEAAGAASQTDPVLARIEGSTLTDEVKKLLTDQYRQDIDLARSRVLNYLKALEG